ncbi:hypothetical protein [Acidithiobacillus thiooxidans]|uniref:Uncharacterized protein n=1 Tax=Acidithiobacillus thiooxidans ATCC 19377 TaxID=637390 RepID=A0A5P9XQC8_ACITH|nr:hypothetical protein [Acidithiobacillus thiooxidans]QFX96062.1 hypothetical protein GCD22_01777 [Acidithiobacillus thiooxidans ATCC 19377]
MEFTYPIFWRRGFANIGVTDVLAYWIQHRDSQDMRGQRVLRYLREVYGSGLYLPWLDTLILIVGVCGNLLAGIIVLTAAWFGAHGERIPISLNGYILPAVMGSLFPLLVLYLGKWRSLLARRRSAAIERLFGDKAQAAAYGSALSASLRKRGSPSLWAFPMGSDGFLTRFDSESRWAIFAAFLLIFYQGNNVPELLMGAIILVVIFFLSFNIIGIYMAFGPWKTAPNMTYPVSVFLEDMRSFGFR